MLCWNKQRVQKKKMAAAKKATAEMPFAYLMRVPMLENLKTRYKTNHSKYFIHGTAGWQNMSATSFFKMFLEMEYCTDFMEVDGQIFVNRPWFRTGSHLGNGKLRGKKIGNRSGAGLEIAVGGKLTMKNGEYYTWFKKKVHIDNVRIVSTSQGYHSSGAFEKLTHAQEKSLAVFLRDMHSEYRTEFHSHDDVSGYRGKTDLGGSLSMPFQTFLVAALACKI